MGPISHLAVRSSTSGKVKKKILSGLEVNVHFNSPLVKWRKGMWSTCQYYSIAVIIELRWACSHLVRSSDSQSLASRNLAYLVKAVMGCLVEENSKMKNNFAV